MHQPNSATQRNIISSSYTTILFQRRSATRNMQIFDIFYESRSDIRYPLSKVDAVARIKVVIIEAVLPPLWSDGCDIDWKVQLKKNHFLLKLQFIKLGLGSHQWHRSLLLMRFFTSCYYSKYSKRLKKTVLCLQKRATYCPGFGVLKESYENVFQARAKTAEKASQSMSNSFTPMMLLLDPIQAK